MLKKLRNEKVFKNEEATIKPILMEMEKLFSYLEAF